MPREKLSDVFKTIGQPTVTYVKRANGKLETQLNNALNEKGVICLITGPSKTGKTTLYREVLSHRNEIPLVVRCDKSKTCEGIWKQALESIEFERLEVKTISATKKSTGELELNPKLGWAWLAELSAKVRGSLGYERNESEARRRVLAEPGPELLIPLLKATNCSLIIEDFHYLEDVQKVLIFQQWKQFIDNEVSVIMLGTTHRAVDIANSNKDLLGRVVQIDVGHWEQKDLERITELGFNHLDVKASKPVRALIAIEAAGLPIIVQQACLAMLTSEGVEYSDKIRKINLTINKELVRKNLHHVAKIKYAQFETYYSVLIRGPREAARRYKTYELVLACFTLDPIKFSLLRREIDYRLTQLGLEGDEFPPAASLNSTLGALKKFQERRNIELLEWRPSEEILYIIEPAFLFYVRWRRERQFQAEQLDMFEILIQSLAEHGQINRSAEEKQEEID